MSVTTLPLTERPAWKALTAHFAAIQGKHLRELFASDPARGERLTANAIGIFLDYSKNRITDETLLLLAQLAKESSLTERTEAMFRGDKINITEHRAVLHTALRAPRDARIEVDGKLRFISDQLYAVITHGAPMHVDMVLNAVDGRAPR